MPNNPETIARDAVTDYVLTVTAECASIVSAIYAAIEEGTRTAVVTAALAVDIAAAAVVSPAIAATEEASRVA